MSEWTDFKTGNPPYDAFVLLHRVSGEYIACGGDEVAFFRKEYSNINKWKVISYAPIKD